ncbi:VOC family protein [Roseovarius arcticus]|uniref:VOC family protein n=1 Tax=Roseovarius arcticus TaxID=2547404 RepID=UPI0011107DA9|nr:VOC family protein [Roseovarius arcticus]
MTLTLDHPLVCVHDLKAACATYQSLGFAMKPPGMHPWGTSTALIIFQRQLLELVSIGDASLLDGYAVGNFRFGRHVQAHLAQREGVPLTALCSDDADGDAKRLIERGVRCEGRIAFGRDVVLADGTPDRTATTLQIFTRPELDRLAMFACQQHRRDLIEFPEWMDHPNGAMGFASATILAAKRDQSAVRDWLTLLHGGDAVQDTDWGFAVDTGGGMWRVVDRESGAALFGPVSKDLAPDGAPSVVSLDIITRDMARVKPYLEAGQFAHRQIGDTYVLTQTGRLGGILLTFRQAG